MFSKLVNALSSTVGVGMVEEVSPRYGLLWEKNGDSTGCRGMTKVPCRTPPLLYCCPNHLFSSDTQFALQYFRAGCIYCTTAAQHACLSWLVVM